MKSIALMLDLAWLRASQAEGKPTTRQRGSTALRVFPFVRAAITGVVLFFATGCQFGVENGQVFSGNTLGKSVTFQGTVVSPEHCISIEVLDPAGQDPFDPNSNWTAIAETVPNQKPLNFRGTELYSWSVSAVIVKNADEQDRWRNGGLARTRARISYPEGSSEAVVFEDFRGCVSLSMSVKENIATCASPDSPVATLVDADPLPTPSADFLSRKETPGLAATKDYYHAVGAGVGGSRRTLWDFLHENNFPGPFTEDVSAVYFNERDLGSGREMHCREISAGEAGICPWGSKAAKITVRTACYVTNYFETTSLPSSDPSIAVDLAVTGHGGGGGGKATVAMERIFYPEGVRDGLSWCHSPEHVGVHPGKNIVRFYAYGEEGFSLALDEVALDNQGAKRVPGLCLSCHGGAPSQEDPNDIVGAEFLPFDVESFSYSTQPGYTLADQQEAFRELNAMVRRTAVKFPSPIVELIDGWYPSEVPGVGVLTPGVLPSGDFVPAGFADNERLYSGVIKPYCRMCHLSQTGSLAFNDLSSFPGADAVATACGDKQMPHAQVTQEAFWNGAARMILQNEVGIFGPCAP